MKNSEIDRLLAQTDLEPVEPSEELVERLWSEIRPIVASDRQRPAEAPAGVDPTAEVLELDELRVDAVTRRGLGRRMLVGVAAAVVVVAGLWSISVDQSGEADSVDSGLQPVETTCQALASGLEGVLGDEMFDPETVARLPFFELEELAAVFETFGATTDPTGLDFEMQQMRIIERALRVSAVHRAGGDETLAESTVSSALNRLVNDNRWHTEGRLSGCFEVD